MFKDIKSSNNIISNAKIAILAQIITLAIGFIKSLVIPGLLNVQEFGYWQIYLLYLPYIGLFYWGFNDGIYLKYGGFSKENLPYEKIRTSIKIFMSMLLIETIILISVLFFMNNSTEYSALFFVVLNITIQGIYGTMIYILQITNRIKEFSLFSVIDKVIFIFFLFLFVILDECNYVFLIIADIGSRLFITLIMILFNKELFFGKHASLLDGTLEFSSNIKIGISLMIASFISMLFTGFGKMFVANSGDINNYAYYAFGMSLINLLLVCFTSISTVIYPILKRMGNDSIAKQYDYLNNYFEIICTVGMLGYFLCRFLIKNLYISYFPVLEYLDLLFVLAIFQGKISLLNNTYYKVMRKERRMLFDNVLSLVFFIILCIVFCNSVYRVALLTCIVMMHRSIDSEIFLRKSMNNKQNFNIIGLIATITIFLICSHLEYYIGVLIYCVYLLIYFLINKSYFLNLFKLIFKL